MSRFFPPSSVQGASERLRNEICCLLTPLQMAEVSSHLRNFAVAEVIGFIAMLDGHSGIIGPPEIEKVRAGFQQAKGTVANPFAHAIPSGMLLNGDSLISFYHSAEARRELERVFGMGVMAPENWGDRAAFPHQPRQLNVVDTIAERHLYGGGLVEAFKECGEAAVNQGVWDGSGKRRHTLDSLTAFIGGIYRGIWVPRAEIAYLAARSHFARQLSLAHSSAERRRLLEQRRDILEAQFRILEWETNSSPEAARNVWKFTASEPWF